MRPPRSPMQRRRFAVRFLIFQLAFTFVCYAVVLSRPANPRSLIGLVGVSIYTVIYACHVLWVFRRTRPGA